MTFVTKLQPYFEILVERDYDVAMKNFAQATAVTSLFGLVFATTAGNAHAFQATLNPDQTLRVTHGKVLGEQDTNTGTVAKPSIPYRDTRVKTGVNPVLPTQSVVNQKIRMSVEDNKGKMAVLDKKQMASPSTSAAGAPVPVEEFEDRFMKLELINPANRRTATSPGEVQNVVIQTPPSQEQPTQLEIESRSTRGLVQPGSNVTVDPRTNEITVSDRQGIERVLVRLPDQAFQEMTAQGAVFPENYDEAKANLTIETTDDGKVVYRTQITNQRKLFGLVPYQVKIAHQVDDVTGEVVSQELPDQSMFGRFRRLIGQ